MRIRRPLDVPALIFAVLLPVLCWDLARVAFVESHWDEDACVTIGWLLSKGWKLYGDVFSHHMPLDYVPSWALACVFGNRFGIFRGFMIVLWALVCAALFLICRRREPKSAILVPFLFAALTSQWLTYWMGQMMLVESYWGYAVVILLALIGSPLELSGSEAARGGEGLAAGALLGFLVSASPACVPAAACLVLWIFRDPRWRGRRRSLAAGFGFWAAPFLFWCALHVDLGQWYSHAVWFNAEIYAKFNGLGGAPVLAFAVKALRDNAAYYAGALTWGNFEQYFEGLLKLSVLGWIGWNLSRRRFFDAAWWAVFVVALKARAERGADAMPFHSGPFYLVAALLLCRELALLWAASRRRPGWGRPMAFVLLSGFFLLPTLIATSFAAASLKKYAGANVQYDMVVASLKNCTDASDRIAVFPFYPRFYLDSGRLPAVPDVFYLPWQEAWPRERDATMAALARNRPKAVVIQDTTVWGVPWSRYGRAVDSWVRDNYWSVARSGTGEELRFHLWLRKDAAAAFVACAQNVRSDPSPARAR
jgi:hypothetical protein